MTTKGAVSFFTIACATNTTSTIKNSQFIAHCARVMDAVTAMEFIDSIRRQHTDATHNCWAYRLSVNEYRFSDDGEPGGTAGQPILQAITAAKLEQTCVVVTRYFGGVKLGAGGLVRAYSGAAATVLKAATIIEIKPEIFLEIEVAFSEQNTLYHYLQTHTEITTINTHYSAEGLNLKIKIYLEDRERLIKEMSDVLRGRIKITIQPLAEDY